MAVAPYLRGVTPHPEVTPQLLGALTQVESSGNPRAVSPKGALGLAQFMPGTAADLGIDPFDPQQALTGARQYLSWLISQTGNLPDALAAYNWGIGNLKKYGRDAAPKKTRDYVEKVLARLAKAEQGQPDSIVAQPANPRDPVPPPELSDAIAALMPTKDVPAVPAEQVPSLLSVSRRLGSLPTAQRAQPPTLSGKESPIEMVEKLLRSPTNLAKLARGGHFRLWNRR